MIYHHYAPFYDGSGQMRFAILMGQYLSEVLERHPAPGQRALDLACGTGTLALQLADDGWDVIGIDASAAMLAQARAKAAALDTAGRASFVQGDMRALATAGEPSFTTGQKAVGQGESHALVDRWRASFDLATCTYDSLNYLLTEDDLAACFAGVAQALRPGGLFVADMNTRHFLENDWGICELLERPGFVQVTHTHFDPITAQSMMLLAGFAGDDQGGYARFDEVHVERAYPPELVARLLEVAGMPVEAAYDCFTFQPPVATSQRIAWVARRAA